MFAEHEIIGESSIKVSKGRQIILPKFTFAEPGDKLGLFYGISLPKIPEVRDRLGRMKLIIMRLQEFEERLERFQTNLDAARKDGRVSYKDYYDYQRIYFAMLAITYEEVTKLGKITLEQIPVRNLNITDSAYAVGNGYHLDIYPSKEIYIKTKNLRSLIK